VPPASSLDLPPVEGHESLWDLDLARLVEGFDGDLAQAHLHAGARGQEPAVSLERLIHPAADSSPADQTQIHKLHKGAELGQEPPPPQFISDGCLPLRCIPWMSQSMRTAVSA